ncbi:hypothetical protein WL88_29070 [Burkholderia diffusa]|uniref:Fimbrial assembly protein n=1 Tax=Burkholderia diffusa TaxID=488732 RepID=A0AAW3P7V8_9BURK|nr:hypothetical protein [Burkholderia diffusa]KWF41397.1 hypothetical protein WL85_00265 [Burkholderia diffusa]KWF44222.1 hypothetical protein WL86_08700 [Burkholderia diffusa]KWF45131.1 hypothetical protein WL88_29070 [Burkholderia diffusa]KWF51114.1 hypothetical protein WL87_14715 [Burkholderia diffusa]
MSKIAMCWTIAIATLLPPLATAQGVNLSGKTTSKVTAQVIKRNNLEVTDANGGWFDQGLEMLQLGGWETPYAVEVRLKVTSTSDTFQVRLDAPLEIRNQSNPAQVFRSPKVTMSSDGEGPKGLTIDRSTEFKNPASPEEGVDSVGYYNLAVSAYPPEGDFRSTAGTYSGVLSMTFEPVVKVK